MTIYVKDISETYYSIPNLFENIESAFHHICHQNELNAEYSAILGVYTYAPFTKIIHGNFLNPLYLYNNSTCLESIITVYELQAMLVSKFSFYNKYIKTRRQHLCNVRLYQNDSGNFVKLIYGHLQNLHYEVVKQVAKKALHDNWQQEGF